MTTDFFPHYIFHFTCKENLYKNLYKKKCNWIITRICMLQVNYHFKIKLLGPISFKCYLIFTSRLCKTAFTCSRLPIETLEQGVKYVQSMSLQCISHLVLVFLLLLTLNMRLPTGVQRNFACLNVKHAVILKVSCLLIGLSVKIQATSKGLCPRLLTIVVALPILWCGLKYKAAEPIKVTAVEQDRTRQNI